MGKWQDRMRAIAKSQYEAKYKQMVENVCPGIIITKCEQQEDKTVALEFKEGKYSEEEVLKRIIALEKEHNFKQSQCQD